MHFVFVSPFLRLKFLKLCFAAIKHKHNPGWIYRYIYYYIFSDLKKILM